MKLRLVTVLLVGTTLIACTKKDKQTPRVESVEINGQFFNARVQVGEDELVTVKLKDDKALKEYFVEIVANNDLEAKNGLKLLSLSNIQGVSGKSNTETYNLNIPVNTTAGLYVLNTIAKDASGNQSPNYKFELIVESPNSPIINITDVLEGGDKIKGFEFETGRGRSMVFSGKVKDVDGFVAIGVKVLNEYDKVEFNKTHTFDTPVTTFELADLEFNIDIPNDAILGGHRIQFTAKDVDGNIKFVQAGLQVIF